MSNLVTGGKVFGFLPTNQYTKITYILLLASTGVALLTLLTMMGGIYLNLGMIGGVCGILALLFAILGIALLPNDLTALDKNHLVFICVLFVAFYVLGFVTGMAGGVVSMTLALIVSIAQLVLVFTGYNSWSKGRIISAENIKSEIQLAVKRS